MGVAVVFEDDEGGDDDRMGDEEEDENAAFEVRDESDDEQEEGIERAQVDGGVDASARDGAKEEDGDEEIVIGDASTGTSKATTKKGGDSDIIPARDIDGFYLQRLVSTSYPDPHETATKTTAALTILSSAENMRDVENSLMDLFDYENFGLVKTLTKNRDKIVWCTKLARSDEAQRLDVEVAMREKGVGWILKELNSSSSSATQNGGGKSKSNAMDVDSPAATSSAVSAIPKTNIAPGSLVQPRTTVDLDSMAFSQGSRLMSNKKCKLPEGSIKRSKKGYEEIHVPPPKKGEAKEGELIPIAELPQWMRAAFGKAQSLNRVQSKVYPVAYGEDDPILLCAPTGAGKVSQTSSSRTGNS